MVLNHEQREYSKLYIKDVLSVILFGPDYDRACEIVDKLFNKHRMRMDIYYDLKTQLEQEFELDIKKFYGVILRDIYIFFQSGLDHLDMFCPTDLDMPHQVR